MGIHKLIAVLATSYNSKSYYTLLSPQNSLQLLSPCWPFTRSMPVLLLSTVYLSDWLTPQQEMLESVEDHPRESESLRDLTAPFPLDRDQDLVQEVHSVTSKPADKETDKRMPSTINPYWDSSVSRHLAMLPDSVLETLDWEEPQPPEWALLHPATGQCHLDQDRDRHQWVRLVLSRLEDKEVEPL